MLDKKQPFETSSYESISGVVVSTVLKPTMILRWRVTEHYNPFDDAFEKVLEQKWISETRYEEWREIEVVD